MLLFFLFFMWHIVFEIFMCHNVILFLLLKNCSYSDKWFKKIKLLWICLIFHNCCTIVSNVFFKQLIILFLMHMVFQSKMSSMCIELAIQSIKVIKLNVILNLWYGSCQLFLLFPSIFNLYFPQCTSYVLFTFFSIGTSGIIKRSSYY